MLLSFYMKKETMEKMLIAVRVRFRTVLYCDCVGFGVITSLTDLQLNNN